MARSVVLSAGGALCVLALAATLDLAKPLPTVEAAARSDRADVASTGCGGGSLIAACATLADQGVRVRDFGSPSVIQVYERPGETVLVRVKLVD